MSNNDGGAADVEKALGDLKEAEAELAKAREAEERAEKEVEAAARELEEAERRHQNHPFIYFVDGVEYKTESSALTGAQIKAVIANFDPAYQLVLEGHGNDPDKVIADNETTSLKSKPHFYTAPPANFG